MLTFNYSFDSEKDIFSRRLCELIKEKNTTKSAIAAELHISRQAVMQYCNGNTFPTADKLRQLAQYFDVSADYLLGLSSFKHEDPKMQQIEQYTGLNQNAIESLHMKMIQSSLKSDIDFVNYFITHGSTINFFVHCYIESANEFMACLQSTPNETEKLLSHWNECRLHLFEAKERFSKMIDSFVKDVSISPDVLHNVYFGNLSAQNPRIIVATDDKDLPSNYLDSLVLAGDPDGNN